VNTLLDTILATGAPVYPATASGRPWRTLGPDIEICDRLTVAAWCRRGVQRLVFRPYDAGMVGIDLDRKNNKDGLQAYITLTGSDPRDGYHVTTPKDGLHLFFWNPDGVDFVSCELRDYPGIESKNRALFTVPGSRSDRGQYLAHGDPSTIGALPEALLRVMPVRQAVQAPRPIPRTGEALALHRINDILQKQGLTPAQGQRNRFCFELARYARRQGHNPDAVLSFLQPLTSGDFPSFELRATVNSAFRGAR